MLGTRPQQRRISSTAAFTAHMPDQLAPGITNTGERPFTRNDDDVVAPGRYLDSDVGAFALHSVLHSYHLSFH
jgi:hypothetical protein